MVILGGKNNALEFGNHIATSMSSALGLWSLTPNSIGNILVPYIVHIYDMVTLYGKDNT